MFRSLNQRLQNETTRLVEPEPPNPPIYITEIKGMDSGSSNFLGGSTPLEISHNLGSVPRYVNIIPIESTAGYLGEIWVTKDSNKLYVSNTGSSKAEFNWIAIK